ncbi:MAG: YceI family protein [Saprospirales bacterium]|nr:YceI family protein [Saprospirales bacterium]MBK8923283.1 YceI family protein [Saprospirales bacterium]
MAAATACWLVAAAYLPAPEQGAGTKAGPVFLSDNGRVNFKSDAPLEVIEAHSNKLRGAVDASDQSFAWIVDIATFEGFNSPLQREHFNENYLETSRFPNATFTGKLIEKIDFNKDGSMPVRAKGKLRIHGVEQERIIKGRIDIRGQRLAVRASFAVPLTDHNISIPKIVHQKIAEEILVSLEADMKISN